MDFARCPLVDRASQPFAGCDSGPALLFGPFLARLWRDNQDDHLDQRAAFIAACGEEALGVLWGYGVEGVADTIRHGTRLRLADANLSEPARIDGGALGGDFGWLALRIAARAHGYPVRGEDRRWLGRR